MPSPSTCGLRPDRDEYDLKTEIMLNLASGLPRGALKESARHAMPSLKPTNGSLSRGPFMDEKRPALWESW